ncbi:MAG: serine O-acetyltransferase [Candidatus Melainabacteria bacterium]|nr:serine O-acetyltransferase [Candidatus Melainabacteria bacterium]
MDWSLISETAETILEKDPAARSMLEVYLCYPGFHAITIYRFAHVLYGQEQYTLARCLSQFARMVTGVEIHPGATIGRRFVIDHGMGVVIGETTTIGDDCFLYQGVTLGAGAEAREGEATRGKKRHPTLCNDVIVGSGAEIQGDIKVGNNVRVASGSIVLKDVPDNSIVVGVPGRIIYKDGKRVDNKNPDPEAEAIKRLKERIDTLEANLAKVMSAAHVDKVAPNQGSSEEITGEDSDESDPVDVFLQGAGI